MRKDLTGSKFMLLLIVWALIAAIIFGAILRIDGLDRNAVLASPWTLIGNQLVVFIVPLAVWLFIKGESFKLNMPNRKLGAANIVLIVAISFFLQPAMMLISFISSQFFHNPVSGILYGFMQHHYLLTIVAIAVTPAICEEVVFRGYIQSQHRDRPIRKAALLNGLFFAIIHLNLQQFAYAFVMGVIFAYMVHYTRSIWAGILPHFIINATQATWGRLALAAEVTEDMPVPAMGEQFVTLGVILLVSVLVAVILFRMFFDHNRRRITADEQGNRDNDGCPRYGDVDAGYSARPDNVPRGNDNPWHAANYEPGNTASNEPVPARTLQAVQAPKQDDPPDAMSSRFDPYAIAVVAVFIFVALLLLLPV